MSARSLHHAKTIAITGFSILFPLLALPAKKLSAQVNVPTWRYDNTHQGQNTQETVLTPTNVNTNTFGKLFSQPVDGQVYAQPLYVSNLTVNGATHNVLFVATEHDSVYAFDADTNGGANSAPLWQASMLSTAHGAASGATTVPSTDVQSGTGDIHPEIGISGTPVIDLANQTLFVLAKTKENGTYVQRLHAINILTGAERSGSPVSLAGSVPGTGNGSSGGNLAFSVLWQNNRPALDLFNGNVYLGFGSHGDDGPWHGWVLVYNENTLAQTAAICTSPNGNGDGVWGAGAGFPIDTVTANGRAFIVTGNGDYTTYPPLSNSVDFGDSILRYDLSNGGFAISDAFTPFNQNALSGADLDQGSGGILMLPDQPGTYPHLLVQVGKEGRILVLNRDKLNGYVGSGAGSNTNAVQDITGALQSDSGLWSTPAYWNGNVYMWASSDVLKAFPLNNGTLATQPSSQGSVGSSFPGATPVVSSNGTQNGIVWAVKTDQYSTNGSSVLYAFNPLNVAQEYYNSAQNPTRDTAGQAVKFVVPVVTNGKVYVGTWSQVSVYGLLNPASQAPAPVITPSGGTYTAAQQITLADSVSGATIYYTTDGTTPTANSTIYVGGFQLSANATVQAIASASGYLQSTVASATYAFITQTPAPQFLPAPGTYNSIQTVTITDSNTNAVIYYTTDGSAPTTSSKLYSGAITVGSNTLINAIAVSNGLTNSIVTTGSYLVQAPGFSINYANGFANSAGLTLNGSATNVNDTRLQLTTGLTNQTASAFYNTPTNIQAFTTDFAFQLSNAQADGFTFTIQNVSPTAIGGPGGGLGYGPDPTGGAGTGISKSVAVKFDFYNNVGEGNDSTGLYTNGATPALPAIDMTSSGVVLSSGDSMAAHITYDGANLVMTITDIVVNKVFTHTWPINIPATVGSNTAYIGFTGASAGETASQKILSWTLNSSTTATPQVATPTFSPAAGTYPLAQSVTIADTTPGVVIYYTTNGSSPTTASAVYGATPIPVAASLTIKALAVATGYTQSPAAAAYVIQSALASPTLSPVAGTYTSAQSVTLTDAGATIYYTTDGSTPTTSSTLYSAPIPVSSNTTVQAIAVIPGTAQSGVASATYVIQSTAPSSINFAGGFPSAAGLQLNGNPSVSANSLAITDGGMDEANSVFWTTPVNIQTFTSNFTFQLTSAVGDGFTFTIQNAGLTAVGMLGGGLGYGINPSGTAGATIGNSVAVKFDIFDNAGEGNNSTGVYTNGAAPTLPAVNLNSSGIKLASGDMMLAQLVYNGTTLTLNLADTVTGATFSQAFPINIPATVGANTAYVGFTGGTGSSTAIQNITTWTFSSSSTPTAGEPVFYPAPGTYTTAQNVSLTSTPGTTIYYTVDGSTPTHASAIYSAPIVVNGVSLTIRAFASATGSQDSPIVVGAYQLQAASAATPVISPGTGTTFSSTLTVSMTDATPSSTIYYTTDGTPPTTGSTPYTGAINITGSTSFKAIAVASGLPNSSVATAVYSLVAAGTGINYGGGFASTAGLSLNGTATNAGGSTLQLTTGATYQTGSAFFTTPMNIQAFTTDFTFQLVNAQADGMTFTIQNVGPAAIGGQGSGLGYGPDTTAGIGTGIANSIAVKFDFFNNAGEGSDSTGLYVNGASPTVPAVDMTPSGVILASGDAMAAHITYDGTNLVLTLTDTVTNSVFTHSFAVNIPSMIGSNTGYLGFTGASGGETAVQQILTWTMQPGTATQSATPNFTPAAGTYTTAQSVILADTTPGAVIYYTTNGATPTTASAVYGAAIPVAASETLQAIAVATGYTQSAVASAAYVIQSTTATPSFTPAAGTYGSAQSVTLTDTTPGAVIYYTTNGATPTTASAVYGAAIPVGASETLQAIAVATGYAQSAAASAAYVIQSATATPSFTPAGGTYGSAQSVTLADTTPGAVIYYTTNGATPTTASAVYGAAIPVGASETLQAIAVATGYTQSAVASAAYVIQSPTATPTFTPVAGTYGSAQSVTLADSTPGAKIYYTTNGTTPTTASAVYGAAIPVAASETLQAIAVATGYTQSAVASAAYVIQSPTATPGFTPVAGTYGSAQSVTLTDTTPGAKIYYTTNGSAPTTASAVYGAAIPVAASETLQAIAVATGYTQSAVASAAYVIQSPAATPTFTPVAGTYGAAQSVTLTDATPGAKIYYTTNGSAPTTASAVYGAAIPVAASETLQAIAVATGYTQSAVASAAYVIASPTATPTFNPAGGTYFFQQSVTLGDATPGAVIYYTIDGSTPTTASAVYSRAIPVAGSFTIKAIAVATGHALSAVASAAYVIQSATATPIFTPAGGTYATAQSVTITDTSLGAKIYYTTNGSTPTTASAVYSRAIPVTANTTLKAIATAFFYTQSSVATASYVITSPAAAPTFTPAGGTYNSAQSVTLADSTPGAAIYYTTNGSTPTTASTLYSGPITVSTNETILAIAAAANYANSAVSAATYSIVATSPTTSVNLSNAFNIYGIFNSGTAPTHGGIDGSSYAYAGSTLPTGITLAGAPVTFGPVGAPDAISSATVALPSGQYGSISVLAAASYGPLVNQTFLVTYTDNTTSTFTQNMSDWGYPRNYAGETTIVTDPQRITPSGATQAGPWYMYGYTFTLNSAKTVKSITLPARSTVFVFAMTLHQP